MSSAASSTAPAGKNGLDKYLARMRNRKNKTRDEPPAATAGEQQEPPPKRASTSPSESTSPAPQPTLVIPPTTTEELVVRPLVNAHADIAQPSAERVEQLLGPAPPAPAQNPRDVQAVLEQAEQERLEMQKRIERAGKRGKNVYYNSAQVNARYGRKNPVSEFIRTSTSRDPKSSVGAKTKQTGVRASRTNGDTASDVDASTMRIDELITAQENKRAADEIATAKVVLADTFTRELRDESRPPTIDEFIDRLNFASTGAAVINDIDNRLFERPYQVVGLSTSEPNPEWERMFQERQALMARRKALLEERKSLTSGRQSEQERTDDLGGPTFDEVRRNEARLRLRQFERLEGVELLKPDDHVAAINLRWRTMLLSVLKQERDRYLEATRTYLQRTIAAKNGTLAGLPSLYVQRVVDPVFNRYLTQIRTSTYEDMPLTAEILEEYFYDFLNFLYSMSLYDLQDPPTAGMPAVTVQSLRVAQDSALLQRKRQLRSLIGLPAANKRGERDVEEVGIAQDVSGLAPEVVDRMPQRDELPRESEINLNAEYLREALNIYASQAYIAWLRLWLTEARRANATEKDEVTRNNNEAKLLIIDRRVRNMVRDREELEDRRNAARGRVLPRFTPQTEAMIRESYAMLLRNEVAFARAQSLVVDKDAWYEKFVDFLTGRTDVPPSVEMALHPRVDIVQALDKAKEHAIESARVLYSGNKEGFTKASDEIDERALDLGNTVLIYAPRVADYVYRDHAPLDQASVPAEGAEDNLWSPYALPYPLSVGLAELQGRGLQSFVLTHTDSFDAEAIHTRANELRSLLSFDYAERLTLRSIAEIDYYLKKVLVPERQVAWSKDIMIETVGKIPISATLELRPELEMGRRLPKATRDERIDEFFTLLNGQTHVATWYFTPAYGVRAGQEHVVFRETLPPGHLTSTYVLNAGGRVVEDDRSLVDPDSVVGDVIEATYHATNSTIGGQYRVEFKVDTATGNAYNSIFKATLRVMARCKRDNEVFEVGTLRHHGECRWREYARTQEIQDIVDEWHVLVRSGQAAFETLVNRRRSEKEMRRITGDDFELFLPPWGHEDEVSLLRAFRTAQTDNTFECNFDYFGVTRRVVARIGGQMRRLMKKGLEELRRASPTSDEERELLDRLEREFTALTTVPNNNMQLFSILVGGMRATEPVIRATYLTATKKAANGAWSTPDRESAELAGMGEPGNPTGNVLRSFIEDLTHNDRPTSVPHLAAQIDDDEFDAFSPPLVEASEADALPVRRVTPIQPGTTQSVESLPLATVLNAMFLPTVWPNLTWREQRFYRKMLARFTRFATNFRFVERRRLYYKDLLYNNKDWDDAVALVTINNDLKTAYNRVPVATPLIEAIEDDIDRRLSKMTAPTVQASTSWYDAHRTLDDAVIKHPGVDFGVAQNYKSIDKARAEFLQDIDLCREYDEKIRMLAQSGLIVPNQTTQTYNITVSENPSLPETWRVANLQTQVDYTTDERGHRLATLAKHRQDWIGEHSYATNQPAFMQLVVDPTRGAAVHVHGSTPVNKGYDFIGLYGAVVETTRAYSDIAHGGHRELVGVESRTRALNKLDVRLQRLELTYNFLAFVAPPLSGGLFLSVDDILSLIDDQTTEKWLDALRATIY